METPRPNETSHSEGIEYNHQVEDTIPSLDPTVKDILEDKGPQREIKWNMEVLEFLREIIEQRRLETFIQYKGIDDLT